MGAYCCVGAMEGNRSLSLCCFAIVCEFESNGPVAGHTTDTEIEVGETSVVRAPDS